ncbi:MAG: hypothetical protein WCE81_10070 [Halobacteriota archaeon]
MEDNEFNTLLKELRNCLMPTRSIEDIFNLTFDVDRPRYTNNGVGGYTTSWDRVDSNQRGALDDRCQYAQFRREAAQFVDDTQYALYCNGNVNVEPHDRVTLKLDDKQDKELVFKVKAVRNPMMRYRYLVVLCVRE